MDEFTLLLEFECSPHIDDDTFESLADEVVEVPASTLSARRVPGDGCDGPIEQLEFTRIGILTTADHPEMTTAIVETIRTFQACLDRVTPEWMSIEMVLVEARNYEESERWRATL